MQRSAQRRSSTGGPWNRRVLAALAAVVVIGSMIAVTQVSDASTRKGRRGNNNAAAVAAAAAAACGTNTNTKTDLATVNDGTVRSYKDDQDPGNKASTLTKRRNIGGRGAQGSQPAQAPAKAAPPAKGASPANPAAPPANPAAPPANPAAPPASAAAPPAAPPAASCPPGKGGAAGKNIKNGLEILGDSCKDSKLQPHTGFQEPNKCSSTAFGEVPAADKAPTLLITKAPTQVKVGQAFTLEVSTRNIERNRFLGAAVGGYYLESSFLNAQGLVRGHFHTACRMLASTTEAPDPAPAPAFFVATEDGKGSGTPDTVKIQVTGMPTKGTAQCASWAGDGSHRIPMMENAKQTPAFDTVRIDVQ